MKLPVPGSTYFTYQVPVHSTSNTCGSSMAGVILQDRDTPADLEQVSKFNSTNQNMCSDAGTYPGVFSDRELFSKTYLRKTLSLRERFAHTNSDSNILATVEKADRVDFLEEDCSTSTGFHEE